MPRCPSSFAQIAKAFYQTGLGQFTHLHDRLKFCKQHPMDECKIDELSSTNWF